MTSGVYATYGIQNGSGWVGVNVAEHELKCCRWNSVPCHGSGSRQALSLSAGGLRSSRSGYSNPTTLDPRPGGEGGRVEQQQRSQGCFSLTSFNPSPLLTVPPGHVPTGQGWFAKPGLGLRSTPSWASARPI